MPRYKRRDTWFFESPHESGLTTPWVKRVNNTLNKDEENDSAYESDDGTVYRPVTLSGYDLLLYSQFDSKRQNCVYVMNTWSKYAMRYIFINHQGTICRGAIPFDILLKKEEKPTFSAAQLKFDFFKNHRMEILQYLAKKGEIRKGTIGKGVYSNARRFEDSLGKRTRVILDSTTPDFGEDDKTDCLNKKRLYDICYRDHLQKTFLFLNGENYQTYRLVVPEARRQSYQDISSMQIVPEGQIKLFVATVRELKKLYEAREVYLDLKTDNIFYSFPHDPSDPNDMGVSNLIDGGLLTPVDQVIDPETFVCSNEEDIKEKKTKHYHIAPECWGLTPVVAQSTMDIYSLGNLMQMCLNESVIYYPLQQLIDQCMLPSDARPSLNQLEQQLHNLLEEVQQPPSRCSIS